MFHVTNGKLMLNSCLKPQSRKVFSRWKFTMQPASTPHGLTSFLVLDKRT